MTMTTLFGVLIVQGRLKFLGSVIQKVSLVQPSAADANLTEVKHLLYQLLCKCVSVT